MAARHVDPLVRQLASLPPRDRTVEGFSRILEIERKQRRLLRMVETIFEVIEAPTDDDRRLAILRYKNRLSAGLLDE